MFLLDVNCLLPLIVHRAKSDYTTLLFVKYWTEHKNPKYYSSAEIKKDKKKHVNFIISNFNFIKWECFGDLCFLL